MIRRNKKVRFARMIKQEDGSWSLSRYGEPFEVYIEQRSQTDTEERDDTITGDYLCLIQPSNSVIKQGDFLLEEITGTEYLVASVLQITPPYRKKNWHTQCELRIKT